MWLLVLIDLSLSLFVCLLSPASDATDMPDETGSSGDHHPPLPPPLPPNLLPPQVRAPDQGRDLLTCGQCCQAFPLAHILAFIQHKQGGCTARNLASNAAPPSPAGRARQHVASAELGPGFIELRRGAAREPVWGEEPGVKVKAEHSKAGELLEEAEDDGRLLISDSGGGGVLLFFFLLFFFLFVLSTAASSFNNRSSSLPSPAH